jgi:hypothetical protein
MTDELHFLAGYQRSLKRWWWVAGLIVLGAAAGFLVNTWQPALYEATATIEISMDYAQTGNLSDFNIDHGLNDAGALMWDFSNMEKISAGLQAQGVELQPLVISKMLYLERRQQHWLLIARAPDPNTAAAMANMWAEAGYQVLQTALGHARRAQILRRYLYQLKDCPDLPADEPNLPELCNQDFTTNWTAYETVQAQLDAEIAASKGLSPTVISGEPQPAAVPDNPVAYNRPWLMLAGALIGLCLGAAVAPLSLSFPGRAARPN